MTITDDVVKANAEHRDWSAFEIARRLDVPEPTVRNIVSRKGLIVPPKKALTVKKRQFRRASYAGAP